MTQYPSMLPSFTRRGLLRGSLLGAGALAVPAALAGCSSDDNGGGGGGGTVNKTVTFGSNYSDEVPKKAISDVIGKFNTDKGFTTTINTIVAEDGKRHLVPMRWGLVPGWWRKPLKDMKMATFNARVETVAEKPMFRSAFKRTRCLIPASGYYEWHTEGKEKAAVLLHCGGQLANPVDCRLVG